MFPTPPTLVALRLNGTMCLAKLWKIERLDGTVLRFTDFAQPIEFEGQTYKPGTASIDAHESVHSSVASAVDHRSELYAGTMDISGALVTLESGSITHDDLRAGRYRDAKVTEYVVDPRVPWAGTYAKNVMWITGVEYDGEVFRAELSSISSWLDHKKGRELNRHCEHRLGQNDGTIGCFFTVPVETADVTSVITQRLKIRCENQSSSRPDDWSTYGLFKWTTGANAGIISEVKLDTLVSGAIHDIEFQEPTPYDIEVGDEGYIEVGCDQRAVSCDTKFGQFENFSGFPDIPGGDRQLETPNAK